MGKDSTSYYKDQQNLLASNGMTGLPLFDLKELQTLHMADALQGQLDSNIKLIEKIKKYQQFFAKLGLKTKYASRKSASHSLRGARGLLDSKGEIKLTVEDIK